MKFKLPVIIVIFLVSSSCTTYKLMSKKYNPDTTTFSKGEVLYYLPKTILQGKVTYTAIIKTTYENGVPFEEVPTYKVKSIEITPVLINDNTKGYVASSTDPSFFLSENTSIKLNKYGVIQSLQTDYTDKTLDVVENTLKGVISVVKTFYVGKGEDNFKNEIKGKIAIANTALVKAIASNNEGDIKKYKSQLVSFYELLKQYYENNKTVITESEVKYDFIKEPLFNSDIVFDSGNSSIPKVTINITNLENGAPIRNPDAQTKLLNESIENQDGLIYSIPKNCSVKATVKTIAGTQIIFDNICSFPQFGSLSTVSVKSKRFTNKKTTIEFDPTSGSLLSLHTESGSSAESVSKTIANSAELLKNTAKELKYDLKIENLKKEKELIDLKDSLEDTPTSDTDNMQKELDLLKIKLEIEKIKKELGNLN